MDLMYLMENLSTCDIPLVAAFFIGLMTAISPCPLATNMTAIAYMSKRIGNEKHTLLISLLYTFGRTVAYVLIASLIVIFGINNQTIALFLQKYGEILIGPILILIGMFMLDIIKINIPQNGLKIGGLKEKLVSKGFIGSFLLGVLFATAFCPFSAVLYFGMIIPLALKQGDFLFIPSVFAIATGLPVIVFSILLVKSVYKLGSVLNMVQKVEYWMRKVVAVVFIAIGSYYLILTYF